MSTDLMESIEAIREDLSEARRYVRTKTGLAISLIRKAEEVLPRVGLRVEEWRLSTCERLRYNLIVARHDIQTVPDVTIGYIDGARWELGKLASELKKEDSRRADENPSAEN